MTVYEVYGMRWAGYMDCDSRRIGSWNSYSIAFFASQAQAKKYLRKTFGPAEGIHIHKVYSSADEVLEQEKKGAAERKAERTILKGRRKGLVKK